MLPIVDSIIPMVPQGSIGVIDNKEARHTRGGFLEGVTDDLNNGVSIHESTILGGALRRRG